MRRDLAQTTFGVLFIVILIVASLWIIRPFLAPVIWAAMIVIATWPLMLRVEAALGRRRWLAVVGDDGLACCWCSWCRSGRR